MITSPLTRLLIALRPRRLALLAVLLLGLLLGGVAPAAQADVRSLANVVTLKPRNFKITLA